MAEPRQFLIPVRRRWTLWILPILAVLYFAVVVTLGVLNTRIRGVDMDMLALGGAAFFVLVVLIELPFFLKRRPKRAKPEPVAEDPFTPAEGVPLAEDDELVMTAETQQGLRVAEYSRPAKSRHPGAVYAKTYVPVLKDVVVRVETLIAEGADL